MGEADHTPFLVEAIDGLARLAADAKSPTALVIDEFQKVIQKTTLLNDHFQGGGQHGAMTAVAVRNALHRDLKDATIRTVLRRLEEKRYVGHRVERGTFIYTAKDTRLNILGPVDRWL